MQHPERGVCVVEKDKDLMFTWTGLAWRARAASGQSHWRKLITKQVGMTCN